ncbi:MAG: hypothetical protein RR012_05740 [Oscillospiraceae bacterium]
MDSRKAINITARWAIAILGTFISGIGAVLFITANNGVDPISVFSQGLSNKIGLPLGTCSQLSSVVVVLIMLVLNRKLLKLGTVVSVFGVGMSINLIMSVCVPSFNSPYTAALATILGAFLLGFGIAIVIFVDIGIGPFEALMIHFSDLTGISMKFVRIVIDLSLTTAGFLMGGIIGWGSVIGVLGLGPIIEYSLRFITFIVKFFRAKRKGEATS